MDPIFQDFTQDLDRVCCQLELIDVVKDFVKENNQALEEGQGDSFFVHAINVYKVSRDAHASLPILTGTLLLYLAGRFEEFAKTLFEDLCQRLVQRVTAFDNLPKKMRENLIIYTAIVMKEPRKYGHAENGVRAFVSTLSENINGENSLTRVNHKCLSITESNMKEDILSDLFERVGASSFWKNISQQASMLAHFETQNANEAERKAKKCLNDLMDQRNRIVHPSGSIEWPSSDTVRQYISYLRVLGKALTELIGVYETTLCQSVNPPTAK